MSKIHLTPTGLRFGATLFFLLLFAGGCSVQAPEIRYSENTRIYNEQANDNPGRSSYAVGRYENGSAPGPRTKKYTVGKNEGATDFYIHMQGNSDISPKKRKVAQQDNFPADMTPEEQRASMPLVIEVSDVLFDFDKAVIKSDFVPELDRWVEYFKNNPLVTADIYGHADSTGPTSYNQKLSERRAEAVIQYIVDRGVKRERFTAKGYGETQPAAPNDTREGRQKNRRVELNF